MKISKVLIATIVVSVFNFIVGALTCGGVFSWVYKVEPTNVWKPMTNAIFPYMIAEILIVNLLFVIVYALIQKGVPGKNKFTKGLIYGLLVWSVGMVPGMLTTALYMTVSKVVVLYWTIWGVIVTPLKGIIISAIYGDD